MLYSNLIFCHLTAHFPRRLKHEIPYELLVYAFLLHVEPTVAFQNQQ